MAQSDPEIFSLILQSFDEGLRRATELDLIGGQQLVSDGDIRLWRHETTRLVIGAMFGHAEPLPVPHVKALTEFVAMAFAAGRSRDQVRGAVASLCGDWDKPWD